MTVPETIKENKGSFALLCSLIFIIIAGVAVAVLLVEKKT